MNLMSDLGHAIVVRRTILKMTQVELARRIGVARSYISLLENGERPLTDDLLPVSYTHLDVYKRQL